MLTSSQVLQFCVSLMLQCYICFNLCQQVHKFYKLTSFTVLLQCYMVIKDILVFFLKFTVQVLQFCVSLMLQCYMVIHQVMQLKMVYWMLPTANIQHYESFSISIIFSVSNTDYTMLKCYGIWVEICVLGPQHHQ